MSQFSTSLEFLLKVRAQGQELLDNLNRQIDGFEQNQREAASATDRLNRSADKQRSSFAGLASTLRAAAAAYIGLAGARRALGLAEQQQFAESGVLGALQAQVDTREKAIEQQRELLKLSADLQSELGIFGDEEFLAGARQLIAVSGRADLDFERLLRVSADAAVSLYNNNLETAVRNIARTFGGQAGELGEVIPELAAIRRELSFERFAEALRKGLVVDLLEQRFSGSAAVAADTDAGRFVAARNRFNDQLERVGNLLLPTVSVGLEALAAVLIPVTSAFETLIALAQGEEERARRAGEQLIDANVGVGASLIDSTAEIQKFRKDLGVSVTEGLAAAIGGPAGAQFAQQIGGLLRTQNAQEADAIRSVAGLARDARTDGPFELNPQPSDPDYERYLRLKEETEAALARLRAEATPSEDSLIDFDDATRRGLVAQLGLVDELNAQVLGLEDSFRKLAGIEEFPFDDLFTGETLREAEAFFNLAKIGAGQEQALRDLAEAQQEYGDAIKRANDLVEAGQITRGKRNELLDEAREKLDAVIRATEGLAEVSEDKAQRSIQALRDLVDEQGDLAITFSLEDTTQIGGQLRDALADAKGVLREEAEEFATLSAEFGERAFGPLTTELDKALKTGEISLQGFATAVLDIFTRLFAEAVVSDLLAGLLGGSAQTPGAGGSLSGFGQFLNLFGGVFGFNEGGVTPGPTRGYDHRLIAVDGGEFVTPAPVLRMPGVRDHLEQLRIGDTTSIDFSRLRGIGPRMPSPRPAVAVHSAPGYLAGGFVDAFASATGSAEDRVFGRGGRGPDPIVVPVAFLDRRTAEAIHNNPESRRVIRGVTREDASASSAAGGRGMPS